MDKNIELATALRTAAQQKGFDGTDALAWRDLLEGAADEIDRLRALVVGNDNPRPTADTRG
jgi:hypothetical protein